MKRRYVEFHSLFRKINFYRHDFEVENPVKYRHTMIFFFVTITPFNLGHKELIECTTVQKRGLWRPVLVHLSVGSQKCTL